MKEEGEYLEGEKNGIWKEYNYNGTMKEEGEYIKGKKNGILKEYIYNGKLEFQGEYKDGLRNGKGKEYFDNGNVLYEGEYADDLRKGNGKEYFRNGKILFSGEYLKGKKWNGDGYSNKFDFIEFTLINGKGRVIEYDYYEELIYEGEYKNGERNGRCYYKQSERNTNYNQYQQNDSFDNNYSISDSDGDSD